MCTYEKFAGGMQRACQVGCPGWRHPMFIAILETGLPQTSSCYLWVSPRLLPRLEPDFVCFAAHMILQFESLKSDFAYNLDLLRQRDEELAEYDARQVRWCAFGT